MKRHTFQFLAWVSVALCVVTVVMWARSFIVCDWIAVERATRYSVGSSQGELVAASTDAERAVPRPTPCQRTWEFGAFCDPKGIALRPQSHLGFGLSGVRQTFGKPVSLKIRSIFTRLVMVPYWALAFLSSILPTMAVWPDLQRRWGLRVGRCAHDRRDTTGDCPKCEAPTA